MHVKHLEPCVACGPLDVSVHHYHYHHRHIIMCPQRYHIWLFKDRNLDSYVNSPNFKCWQLMKTGNAMLPKLLNVGS